MSALSELHVKAEEFKTKLTADASHLVDEFEALLHTLLGQGETDAKTVAVEAETAAAPVVKTVESDAAALGESAVQEGEQAAKSVAADVSTQSAPAATTSPTEPATPQA